ncbi:hypothetical protein K457DRAFT_80639, partial [Linnemannia elongata AG-77]
MKRLGSITVFFFLSKIWNKHYFPGPYNALEKGIAFLYFFVAGETMDSMAHMDCIALDGGYTNYIADLVEKEKLEGHNFCFPIRKKRLQLLHEEESSFNALFGGFRSMVEAVFGDLMKTFAKFNNKEIVRTACKKEFNLAFRLCLLLLNVRNFAQAMDIEELPHHRAWMNEGVDYPR